MKKMISALLAMLLTLFVASGAQAAPTANFQTANLKTSGTLQAGNTTITGTLSTSGNATVGGTLTVTGAPTFTSPIPASSIQTGSAKRQVFVAYLSPNTGAAVDSTVYRATIFPGRAGTVTRITFGCQTAPTVGTDTIKVLKNSSSGNTMLSAATFDANTLVAFTGTNATLTATSADLGLTATQSIYCEYSAGVQTVDGIGITATIEFEPTDF